jgi:hypothetical protein
MARFRPLRRRVIIGAEIKLDVLAGAECLARTGKHENVGLRIDSEFGERVIHLEMELRAHGVALVRPVHDQPRDAVLLLDEDGLVFVRCHCHLLDASPSKAQC